MSFPEISRRCLKCGAAVRAGARFCQQCGQAFGGAGQPQTRTDADRARGEDVGATADDGIESLAARLSAELTGGGGGGAPRTRDVEVGRDVAPTTRDAYVPAREEERIINREGFDEGDAVVASEGEGGDEASGVEGRSRVARVRETARERVESTKARAAKMRDEALVALEETPDDSGLRFIIVAMAVFLLFLLFLFFSTSVLR
jgi:hypothetical protein